MASMQHEELVGRTTAPCCPLHGAAHIKRSIPSGQEMRKSDLLLKDVLQGGLQLAGCHHRVRRIQKGARQQQRSGRRPLLRNRRQ